MFEARVPLWQPKEQGERAADENCEPPLPLLHEKDGKTRETPRQALVSLDVGDQA